MSRRLPSERLQKGAQLAEAMAAAVRGLEAQIRGARVAAGSYLDSVIERLESCCRELEERLPQLVLVTAQLHGNDRRTCESTLTALAALIESAKGLRAAVIEHDLGAETLADVH